MGRRSSDPMLERVTKSFATMPHQGDAPIFISSTAKGTDAPRGEVSFAVQKPVMEDIGWLIKTLAR